MKNEFTVPAKPWGEKEVAFLYANVDLLDNKTRAELGLEKSKEAPKENAVATPSTEPVVEDEEAVETGTPETGEATQPDPETKDESVTGDDAAKAAMEEGDKAAEAVVNKEETKE